MYLKKRKKSNQIAHRTEIAIFVSRNNVDILTKQRVAYFNRNKNKRFIFCNLNIVALKRSKNVV